MTKRWLFITYCPDPKRPYLNEAARYRCFDRAEDLRAEGLRAAVISQQRFMRSPPLDFDLYVFHQPWHTQDFEGLLAYLRRRGKRLLADYDAPVFVEPRRGPVQPPYPELPSSGVSLELRFMRALECFETVLAATPTLAETIRNRSPGAAVHVIESGLSASWREMADSLYRYPPEERTGVCAVGGPELELDMELLGRVLRPVLEKRPELGVIGEPPIREFVKLPPERLAESTGGVGRQEVLGRSHTLLLPASTTSWNAAVSGVRALEAAYMGCDVIASPLPGLMEYRDAGLELPESPEDWIHFLERAGVRRDERTVLNRRDYAVSRGASAVQTRRMIEVSGG